MVKKNKNIGFSSCNNSCEVIDLSLIRPKVNSGALFPTSYPISIGFIGFGGAVVARSTDVEESVLRLHAHSMVTKIIASVGSRRLVFSMLTWQFLVYSEMGYGRINFMCV